MSLPAPFVSTPIAIADDWIDYNGHLNMAFYTVIADRGSDQAFTLLGMGADYARQRRLTLYTAEAHLCYLRELHQGEPVTVTFRILDFDAKRLHVFQEIVHADGWTAATCESLLLHVDMGGPKVTPFPADILARLEAMRAAHASLPVPERAGRGIGIGRKS